MNKMLNTILLLGALLTSCQYKSPEPNQGVGEEKPKMYVDLYDPVGDKGQYWLQEHTVKPLKYWNCVEVVSVGSINGLGHTEKIRGLQYHLMCQSMAGLANKAVKEGRSQVGVWLHDHSGKDSYKRSKQALDAMGIREQGMQSGLELARNNYGPDNGVALQLKDLFDGYVLTDVENNPESNIVASIASHVYNSIIVDVRDKAYYEEAGYKMTYDASKKSTVDAWKEFKDKCSNEALVVMPVQTGELREFAIANDLFVINLNKVYADPSAGQNAALLEEILAWLKPNSPVYGWEQGVGEDVFVEKISAYGHMMVPYDWGYNTTLTSFNYKARQQGLAKAKNPQFFDYKNNKGKFVTFHLSDGDNVQWMLNTFNTPDYYTHPDANATKMAFGLPIDNLSMIAPEVLNTLLAQQQPNTSLVQTFGGGYNYVDNFGTLSNRPAALKSVAEKVGNHMRQRRVKVLSLMASNVRSAAAKEAYQAYVDANDQLEGVIAVQYSPYAGGAGDIIWVTNKQGYDIPVITVKYSLWNFNGSETEREGSPTYIAGKLNAETESNPFSIVSVHAWSTFEGQKGAGVARQCMEKLDKNTRVVSIEEMIWRVRMQYRAEQTQKFLSNVF